MYNQTTERFSNRVLDYIRYRPDYPAGVLPFLIQQTGWKPGDVLADVGSGTGIFTRHLLDAGFNAFALEPNTPMREAAEAVYSGNPGFTSINGQASETKLGDYSVDGIVCAQAFHWFNTPETKEEFRRILKTDGFVALIWNNRQTNADAFAAAYDALLLQQSKDYAAVNHQNLQSADFAAFFRDGKYQFAAFPNEQIFDEIGFIGRVFSSSYVPPVDSEAGKAFAIALAALFRQYEKNGTVRFRYDTKVYLGHL